MLIYNITSITGRIMVPMMSIFLITVFSFQNLAQAQVSSFNVVSFGADASGVRLSTVSIQNAINAAAKAGGGEVYFPTGRFKTTNLVLKSNVTLNISGGATLAASENSSDYTNRNALIGASHCSHVEITGGGTIDGAGEAFYDANNWPLNVNRHGNILNFWRCEYIKVNQITLKDSVGWTQAYFICNNVTVDNIKVRNPEMGLARWTDGIDLMSCQHVSITNSDFEVGDDGICLKSLSSGKPNTEMPDMYDIFIKNNVVATTGNATRIGNETKGNIYNVVFEDITVNKHSKITSTKNAMTSGTSISAIRVDSHDGASVHDIVFRNYVINDTAIPILVALKDNDSYVDGPVGEIFNVTFENIHVLKSERSSVINTPCNPSAFIRNLTFKNIEVHNFGTQNISEPLDCMETYPRLGGAPNIAPSYGLFARNVKGILFDGLIRFYDDGLSRRNELFFEDVTDFIQMPFGDSPVTPSGFEIRD